ncbi:MAG: AsnC family transcriptional regulator, partial [bacterium]|nr:AsnC family transcriptional regulator [bacterium]
ETRFLKETWFLSPRFWDRLLIEMDKLTGIDKRIIREIGQDMPDSKRPYQVVAERLGISEETLIARLQAYKEMGIMRRFGAILYHREAGLEGNCMVAWKVPDSEVSEIGKVMASVKQVTHCYERCTHPDWPYNLYTMIHGKTKKDCAEIAGMISSKVGIIDYRMLCSTKEFKKTSMRYYPE